jgi:hypothetical protein
MASPPRTCIHVKTNGVICGSPALRNSVKCHYHHGHRRRLKRNAVAQDIKTRAGRLAAVQKVVDALLTDRIDPDVARTMLYAISIGTNMSP